MLLESLLHDSRTEDEISQDKKNIKLERERYKKELCKYSQERVIDYKKGIISLTEFEERRDRENDKLELKYTIRLKNLRLNRKLLRNKYNNKDFN